MYCYRCGKELEDSSRYCKYCGEEQPSYQMANLESFKDDNSQSSGFVRLINTTAFKIYTIVLSLWIIAWIQDWFDLYDEDYVSLTITYFIITPLVIDCFLIKWIKKLLKKWSNSKK